MLASRRTRLQGPTGREPMGRRRLPGNNRTTVALRALRLQSQSSVTRLDNIKLCMHTKQLAHLPIAFLLLWGVIACCCSEALANSETSTANPAEPGRCSVPGAPTVLAEALCSGRSEQLQGALDSLKDADNPPTFLDVI